MTSTPWTRRDRGHHVPYRRRSAVVVGVPVAGGGAAAAGKTARRKGGKLPPQVMVYFVMGLALWAEEDYEEVWAKITESLADWGGFGGDQALVTTGGAHPGPAATRL